MQTDKNKQLKQNHHLLQIFVLSLVNLCTWQSEQGEGELQTTLKTEKLQCHEEEGPGQNCWLHCTYSSSHMINGRVTDE